MTEEGIEGTWERTQFVFCGKIHDLPYRSVLILRSGTYTRYDSNGDILQGRYRIDPAGKPQHFDLVLSSGPFGSNTLRDIYEIRGDTLRLADKPRVNYAQRPHGFEDDTVEIGTYKRVK